VNLELHHEIHLRAALALAHVAAQLKGQKATQGRKRSEGNAHANRRQEAGEGGCGKEAGGQTAAEVSLGPVNSS